jgi:hypothetical protein
MNIFNVTNNKFIKQGSLTHAKKGNNPKKLWSNLKEGQGG